MNVNEMYEYARRRSMTLGIKSLTGVLLGTTTLGLMGAFCSPGNFKLDTADTGVTAQDDTGEVLEPLFDGTIEGNVRVVLFSIDEDGEYIYKDWTSHGNDWPFGNLWVYGFTTDEETGDEEFFDSESILTPSQDGNSYSLSVKTGQTDSIRVGAQLDYYADGIMGTWDPVGIYPQEISIDDGTTVTGVDITLLAYWAPNDGSGWGADGWGWGSGNGSHSTEGGGNGDGTTTLSGDMVITYTYAGGDAAAMLMNASNGQGPYYSDTETPEAVGGGAEAPYSMTVWADYGEMNLIGCHDSNYSQLIEASDECGAYITAPDEDGNPVNVAVNENLEDMDIQIPLGDYELELVPFVRLYGEVTSESVLYADYPAGTSVHIAALKYLPGEDEALSDMEDEAYDIISYEWSEVEVATGLEFNLAVPANTIVYLVAYADEDNDGIVAELDEAKAHGGNGDHGRVPTSSSSQEMGMILNPDVFVPQETTPRLKEIKEN